MVQEKDLVPYKELHSEDGYYWTVYHENDTGLRLVCLEDPITGIVTTTTVANPDKRLASHRAWAGARHSRAPGKPWEIMQEMGLRGVDPDQKLDEMFKNYGHASVGDMARIEVDIVGNPMHFCFALFNEGVINSGQEKSTRYQPKFGRASLHPIRNYLPEGFPEIEIVSLEERYQQFGEISLGLFAQYRQVLTEAFTDFYSPSNKGELGSLNSRVLDCVRYFLLMGQGSGMSFETSARDWARIISEMKASPIKVYGRVARQIERLLTPSEDEEKDLEYKAEAPSLLRHTKPARIVNHNLEELRIIGSVSDLFDDVDVNRQFRGRVDQKVVLLDGKYTAGDRLVSQHLLTIWPGLDKDQLLEWVHNQDYRLKKEISRAIFNGHNNYFELPVFDGTTDLTLVYESFLGEDRDFNRHRPWSRFAPLPLVFGLGWNYDTVKQITANGFGLPLYLTEIDKFNFLGRDFVKDLTGYYQQLDSFIEEFSQRYGFYTDYSFVLNLLPLAHQMDLWMHGNPKQSLYITSQRVRNGGHINYRSLASDANQLIASSDPYLSAMRLNERPDPSNREQFFDRS